MSENKVHLHLTSAQKNKFVKGLPFQMTAGQCSSKSGKHHICAVLSKKDYNKLLSKTSRNKGMRFSKDTFLDGSGLFKDVMKGIAKGVAPILIDKIGDVTNTRNLTDSLLKPNSDKIIDFVAGSGFQIDEMRSAVMPRDKLLRPNEMRPTVMPNEDLRDKILRQNEIRFAVVPNQEIGSGMKNRKARFVKGSKEAKEGNIRRGKGCKKEGGNIFDDIGRKLKETFNPDLGRKIKDALTSDTAKQVYKGVADTVIPIIATSTGNPMLGQIAKIGVDTALGSGLKKKRLQKKTTNIKSNSSNLIHGVPQVIKSRLQGGSFKGL